MCVAVVVCLTLNCLTDENHSFLMSTHKLFEIRTGCTNFAAKLHSIIKQIYYYLL